ncbi:MAG: hypothetical protein JWM49_922 [Microbacteriaceae bacterium]|nr:hypothetical protein [Microbacteriaceae bacterium]
MDETISEVAAAADALGAAAGRSVSGALDLLGDEDLAGLLAEVERAGRLIDTMRVAAAAEADVRSNHDLGNAGLARRLGHSRGTHLVEHITRVSQSEAARRIQLGTLIRSGRSLDGRPIPSRFPAVAAAMGSGLLGIDAAARITRCLTQASRVASGDALRTAEEKLVTVAAFESADLVAVQARVWREALDPDGALPRDAELRQRRGFSLGREVNGMSPFSGWADPTSSALLRAMFAEGANPSAKPRFLDPDDLLNKEEGGAEFTGDCGEVIETIRDPRTREQRQFDILIGTLTAGLRRSEHDGGFRPMTTVMAVVKLTDLRKGTGVGWLDDVDEPVSAATMQQLACDSGYREVLVGDGGEILKLGTAQRLFSGPQRKALAVRDGGCVWPQCTAPPSWCEAHHVVEYKDGGATDVDNGALLCSAHHHMLHASEFIMRMINGKPHLLTPPWLDPDQLLRPLGQTRALLTA